MNHNNEVRNPFLWRSRLNTVFIVLRQERGTVNVLGVFSTRIGAESFISNISNEPNIQIIESILDPFPNSDVSRYFSN